MKRIFSIFVLLLPLTAYALDVGDIAPDFTAVTLDGKELRYSDFKDKKPVYIIFWATWCPNCKAEIPRVVELYKKLRNKIEFIGINVGINERLKNVRLFVKSNGMDFKNVFDRDGRIIRAFGVVGTPTHIVISRKGVIRYRDAEMPSDLEKHIERIFD